MPRLSRKQKGFVKDIIAGSTQTKAAQRNYNVKTKQAAQVIGSQNMHNPNILEALQPYLKKHHIDMDTAIAPIGKSLKAKKQIITDTEIIETDIDDLDLQLKASDRALKLLGVSADKNLASQTFIQINQQHINKYLDDD